MSLLKPMRSSLSVAEQTELIAVAARMADAARDVILPFFRGSDLGLENKELDAFDPVTLADKAAEKAMRTVLAAERPQDGVWGEEFGQSHGTSGLNWVLDPIDGTRGFISGTPTWGVLIALSDEEGPLFGIIDQPYIGERFMGGLGKAQFVGPMGLRKLAVRPTRQLGDATLYSTFPEIGTETDYQGFNAVAERVKLVRYGADCYAYALLAAGQIDLVIEAGLNAYDIQAPIAVVEAAGGIVSNWSGGSAHLGGQVLACSSKDLHDQTLSLLAPFSRA